VGVVVNWPADIPMPEAVRALTQDYAGWTDIPGEVADAAIAALTTEWHGCQLALNMMTASNLEQADRAEEAEAEVKRWKDYYDKQANLHERLCCEHEELEAEVGKCRTARNDAAMRADRLQEQYDIILVEKKQAEAEMEKLTKLYAHEAAKNFQYEAERAEPGMLLKKVARLTWMLKDAAGLDWESQTAEDMFAELTARYEAEHE
jgi:hypothetical protein